MPETITLPEAAIALLCRLVPTDDRIKVTPDTRPLYRELAVASCEPVRHSMSSMSDGRIDTSAEPRLPPGLRGGRCQVRHLLGIQDAGIDVDPPARRSRAALRSLARLRPVYLCGYAMTFLAGD